MEGCLNFTRWLLAILLSIVLFLVLTTGIAATAVSSSLVSSETILRWVEGTGIYDNAVEIIYSQITTTQESEEIDKSELFTEEEFIEVGEEIFTPEWIEENITEVVEGTYSWLEGETASPTFTIDFTDKKDEVIDAYVDKMQAKYEKLPNCTAQEMQSIDSSNPDTLTLECVPTDFPLEEQFDSFAEDMKNDPELFPDTIYEAEDLPISEGALWEASLYFSILKESPIFILITVFVLTLALILVIPGWKASFILTGAVWLLSGLIMQTAFLAQAITIKFIQQLLNITLENDFSGEVTEIIEALINNASQDILEIVGLLSGITIGFAIAFLVIGFIIPKQKREDDSEEYIAPTPAQESDTVQEPQTNTPETTAPKTSTQTA